MSSDGEHPKNWTNTHEQTVKANEYMVSLKARADEAMEAWRKGDMSHLRNRLDALGDMVGEVHGRLDTLAELSPYQLPDERHGIGCPARDGKGPCKCGFGRQR